MSNKQEELEAIVQQENYDVVAVMETWWDDSHNWSAPVDGYKLFRRNRLMVGLDDLKGPFQPGRFYDSVIIL
ncbi:rna-directed dna polymerase from mobile element jockey-like [Limosa lapponica baueri]|uniref:Rna-directed dna polymerase from mobile element jockey-like n=1 Tax=Limosa lapponica baueri TaxID=1758121 RepID=A0A2I0UN47_LIMLA|nr:rna-directed dna polymerase from mobile element jockey-like [Limosa lapponica baueri]